MNKSVLVVFSLVLLITLGLVVIYLLSIQKSNLNPLSTITQESVINPELFPNISWEDITSGAMLNNLENEDKNGQLPQLPTSSMPVSQFTVTKPDLIGITYLEISSDNYVANKYQSSKFRPFRFVTFYKTILEGEPYVVMVQKWLNLDGSTAYIPFVIPEKLALINGTTSSYFQVLTSADTDYFLSPILQIESLDVCKVTLAGREAYCKWYFTNLTLGNTLADILHSWVTTNIIPQDIGKIPLVFTGTKNNAIQ